MKNNYKTLTIETKKLWITEAILSILASIYPTLLFAVTAKSADIDQSFKEYSLMGVFHTFL